LLSIVAIHIVGDDEDLGLQGHADVGDVDEVDQRLRVAAVDRRVAVDAGADALDEAGLLREPRHEDAHGHRLALLDVLGLVDHAGRADAELGDHAVAVGQHVADEDRLRPPRLCVGGFG
jgi:hypothetical protein